VQNTEGYKENHKGPADVCKQTLLMHGVTMKFITICVLYKQT